MSAAPGSRRRSSVPATGPRALGRLVACLAGRGLPAGRSGWWLPLEVVPPEGTWRTTMAIPDRGKAREDVLREAGASAAGGAGLYLHPQLRRERVDGSGPRTVEERAPLTVELHLDLADLYAPEGPLRHEKGPTWDGNLDVGDWKRARSFALEHQRTCVFPASIILECGWNWRMLYVLERPCILDANQRDALRAMGDALARLTWCTEVRGFDTAIPLERLVAPRGAADDVRLLRADAKRRYDPDRVVQRARAVLGDLARLHPPNTPRKPGPLPPAMSLPTLPSVWDLDDLDLPGRLKQIVARALDHDGTMALRVLPEIIEALARRGHGWPDVLALLEDSRHSMGSTLSFAAQSVAGLKQHFRQALERRDAQFPVRLPWGLRHIVRVGPTHPGEGRRYVLRGRHAGQPFELEVPWEVLESSAKLRTSLSRHLEVVLPPIPPGIWRPVLAAAMRDPRRFGRECAADGDKRRPLTAHIEDYLRGADPYLANADPGLSACEEAGWPLVREGVVVVPLGVLHRHLRRACGDASLGRGEVVRAVRSLGGGPLGVLYFGKGSRIRVWSLPIPPSLPWSLDGLPQPS